MIYTITGDNDFERQRDIATRIREFITNYGEFGLERLQGDEATAEQLQAAITSVSFLATRKLVVLRAASANKQLTDILQAIAVNLPETTDVILDEPSMDKRTTYYKWAKVKTQFVAHAPLDARQLAVWATQYATEQGVALQARQATYLIQRVGEDQLRLAHELDKLALLGDTITQARIDALTEQTPQSKIFALLDAAFAGNRALALHLYGDQRAQQIEPQEILAMIGWQLRQIALVKTAGSHDAVRDAKMSPYSVGKARAIARRMPLATLKQLVHELATIDTRSKRSSIDLDQALQAYIAHIG